ncbi:MAG: hypothetical protein AAFQ87_18870 [Bacteroidota bacterium]
MTFFTRRSFTTVRIRTQNESEVGLEENLRDVVKTQSHAFFGRRLLRTSIDGLLEELSAAVFSDIESIEKQGGVLQIAIGEISPDLIICTSADGRQCRYTKRGKRISLEAPSILGGHIPMVITSETVVDEIAEKQTAYLLNILDISQESGVLVSEINAKDDGLEIIGSELLEKKSQNGFSILFPPQDNFSEMAIRDILENINDVEEFWGPFSENPDNLEYIDLRFQDRLIYKFTETA